MKLNLLLFTLLFSGFAFFIGDSVRAKELRAATEREQILTGANYVVKVTWEDLDLAETNQVIQLYSATAGETSLVEVRHVEVITPFTSPTYVGAGNDDQSYIEIGDGSDSGRFLAKQIVHTRSASLNSMKAGTGTRYAYASADTVDLLIASGTTSNDVSVLGLQEVGELLIFMNIIDRN